MKKYTPIAVAYKKKTGEKVWVKEFTDLPCPDRLITKRSKLLPEGSEIIQIGVGSAFKDLYQAKFNKK